MPDACVRRFFAALERFGRVVVEGVGNLVAAVLPEFSEVVDPITVVFDRLVELGVGEVRFHVAEQRLEMIEAIVAMNAFDAALDEFEGRVVGDAEGLSRYLIRKVELERLGEFIDDGVRTVALGIKRALEAVLGLGKVGTFSAVEGAHLEADAVESVILPGETSRGIPEAHFASLAIDDEHVHFEFSFVF